MSRAVRGSDGGRRDTFSSRWDGEPLCRHGIATERSWSTGFCRRAAGNDRQYELMGAMPLETREPWRIGCLQDASPHGELYRWLAEPARYLLGTLPVGGMPSPNFGAPGRAVGSGPLIPKTPPTSAGSRHPAPTFVPHKGWKLLPGKSATIGGQRARRGRLSAPGRSTPPTSRRSYERYP